MENSHTQKFIEKIQLYIEKKQLIKLTLSSKRTKTSDLNKVIISAIELKKGYFLNFVYRHKTKDITKNYEIQQGLQTTSNLLETSFLNAEMLSTTENNLLYILPNGKVKLKTKILETATKAVLTHDKNKERLISLEGNIYLRELGITNANAEVRREMSDKYKQINQYIELLAPYFRDMNWGDNFQIVDMGSGKGYLTFALYDFITNNLKLKAKVTGVEYRDELVTICNEITKKANFENLNFIQGTIEKSNLSKIDILIALHACDTATDEAIYRGIRAEADLIVCAPCCHKQIRKAMTVNNELKNITRFGILKERQAEIITDTIRAMILEINGYKTNVFEFISLEHTPKNVMIVAKKTKEKKLNVDQLSSDVAYLKKLYGINKHYLETLLQM